MKRKRRLKSEKHNNRLPERTRQNEKHHTPFIPPPLLAFYHFGICPVCGKTNTTRFCTSCGTIHDVWICPNCGTENDDAFCGVCGTANPFDFSSLYGTWKHSEESYIIFREDGTFLKSANDVLTAGSYTATAVTITFTASESGTETVPYTCTNNLLYFVNPHHAYTRTEEPAVFKTTMDGISMEDTIPNGTTVYFSCCNTDEIRRFDIAAILFPVPGGTPFIKRIVGLPGDVVELRDGYLYINNEKQEEDYISDEYHGDKLNQFGPFTVPEGHFFVLSDHRNSSNDSRSFGPLKASMIIGIMTHDP